VCGLSLLCGWYVLVESISPRRGLVLTMLINYQSNTTNRICDVYVNDRLVMHARLYWCCCA